MLVADNALALIQHQFSQAMRTADSAPSTSLPRPMAIYRELVYSNIENFLSGFFPVLRQVLAEQEWHYLVRQFIQLHDCQTPYFLEISQEFINFLMSKPTFLANYPPFIIELAHYEWVELALATSTEELPASANTYANILTGVAAVSPLAWCLSYQYPVHLIGSDNLSPAAGAFHLVVYRNRRDEVKFLAANPLTLRLLALLQQSFVVKDACKIIAEEICHPDIFTLQQQGNLLIEQMLELDIILSIDQP